MVPKVTRRIIALPALTLAFASLLATPVAAQSAVPFGKLSGTVVDPLGVPQMGATVAVTKEGAAEALQLLSNEKGSFLASRLLPGLYTIRVTLAGFLPALERNVRIEANLTTILKIELGSIFSSLDALRRKPKAEKLDADEWAWVLRTSASSRAILRFNDGEVLQAGNGSSEREGRRLPHARVELTSGSNRPGSVSNIADGPSSAVAYDQNLGAYGRMTFAGQTSFQRSAAAGFAASWVPAGAIGQGPEVTLALRQTHLGPSQTPFRGARLEHNSQLVINGLTVDYGAEYIVASITKTATSIRPNATITYQLDPEWRAIVNLSARPWAHSHGPRNPLQSVLEELDAFPAILVRDGRPVIEGGWHEEIALERRLGPQALIVASFFRDRSRHTALFGQSDTLQPDALQDVFGDTFAYDGGDSGSLGSRVAYRQKLSDGSEVVVLYAWAGALVPVENPAALALRDTLDTRQRHSVSARVSTRVPLTRTQFAASYKWLSSPVVSRQDAFGEVAYQIDPFLSFSVRQPLPTLFATRIEALADFRNLLAQGYVPVNSADGRVLLVPAFRTFRGGFSFQF